jgi:hypothetical protein
LDDIILIPFHWGTLYRYGTECFFAAPSCTGIKLNHLIWINKGNGTFENYKKASLDLPDVRVNYVLPYKVGEYLHFVGTEAVLVNWPNFSTNYNLFDIRLKLD